MTEPQQVEEGFIQRHLDPASRLGEVLFGLIMVLTVTLTADVATGGKAAARELLIAAVGCNIAWGLIDAIMYLMNCLTLRTEKSRLIQAVQGAPDADAALRIIRERVGEEFDGLVASEDRAALYQSMLNHLRHSAARKASLRKRDIYGAIASFWLVFLACLPAALPFLVFHEPIRALRVSNFLLLVMLFLVGCKWAKYAGANRLAAGMAMVVLGMILVGVAVLLGG